MPGPIDPDRYGLLQEAERVMWLKPILCGYVSVEFVRYTRGLSLKRSLVGCGLCLDLCFSSKCRKPASFLGGGCCCIG